MTKTSQTPSKTKSSSKPASKSKIEKSKPKISVNSIISSGPLPAIFQPLSSDITVPAPTITPPPQSSTISVPPSQKITTRATVTTPQITSKPTKVKASSRKLVKGGKQIDSIVVKGEPEAKGPITLGEHAIDKGEQLVDSEEEKESEGEENSESKCNEGVGDNEKESEDEDSKSESEKENTSEDFEGSMTIRNTGMAPLEEVNKEEGSEKPRPSLTPFLGDKEVESDEDDMPLSEVGKKKGKAPVKPTRAYSQARK
uniref:Uncharacterized protein DDB_G0286299-like n=1 Tax=Nicotiana tabacum TaxID=4097 RepID=A0A1S3YHG4_TOBAC|nr:PREDICTED: uncharacterized protein DDB_G0286299-like [Nicotiana tabacum]